jgi:hypothetical protein
MRALRELYSISVRSAPLLTYLGELGGRLPLLALLGHGALSDLSPLSGLEQKSDGEQLGPLMTHSGHAGIVAGYTHSYLELPEAAFISNSMAASEANRPRAVPQAALVPMASS